MKFPYAQKDIGPFNINGPTKMIIRLGSKEIKLPDYPISDIKIKEIIDPILELFKFEFDTPNTLSLLEHMINESLHLYIIENREQKINILLK